MTQHPIPSGPMTQALIMTGDHAAARMGAFNVDKG
jgi:hypothetical protein